MSELQLLLSTPSWRWILQGWESSYQPRSPTHWRSRSGGGLQSPLQIPSAFGDMDICQCARAQEACATCSFLLVFSHQSGKVPMVKFRELHGQEHPWDSHVPSNQVRSMKQPLLSRAPRMADKSPQSSRGSNPGSSAWNPFPGQSPSQFWSCPLPSMLSGPKAGKYPSLCLEKPTALLRNSSHQALDGGAKSEMGAQCPMESYQSHETKSTGTGMMGQWLQDHQLLALNPEPR